MGGAYVFPGGKLDDDDMSAQTIAQSAGRSPAQAREALGEADSPEKAFGLFVTAIRETFEEAGLLIAHVPIGSDLVGAREKRATGAPFSEIVVALRATLALDQLVPMARWITPAAEPKRYDTRFFLAPAPTDQTGSHDHEETTEALWTTPSDALLREARGEILLPPPTLRTLEILSHSRSVDDALLQAASRRPPLVEPILSQTHEGWFLLLPGDPDHPVKEPRIPGPVRIELKRGRFWGKR
jgi:8-oxo-dGTP pyrophosphatase MutT (NUDIX family)